MSNESKYRYLREVVERVQFYTGILPGEDPMENERVVGEDVILHDFERRGVEPRETKGCLWFGLWTGYLMQPRPGLYRYLD